MIRHLWTRYRSWRKRHLTAVAEGLEEEEEARRVPAADADADCLDPCLRLGSGRQSAYEKHLVDEL